MPQAEVHHAALQKAKQIEVGKVSGVKKDRQQTHRGVQFRIVHQRQVDQVLDRAPLQVAPDLLVLGLDLRRVRVCRKVDAEQAQASECAVDGLWIFHFHDLQLDLQLVDGRPVDVRRRALQQLSNQLLG